MAECDCITVNERVVVPEPIMVKEVVALPGEKGDKGDPFTYDDFTPEQIAELQRPATEAAAVANQAAKNANNSATDIKALGIMLAAEEAKRESAESSRASAESERAEAEALRESSFSQMQTTLEGLISDANTATSNANTAAGSAENAATEASDSATLANAAAEKANQAAESIAYNENGFYISHALLEATGLRYIGFKEIKDDKTCYLLTAGRCLKFSLDTYEVFWDVKLEGYGSQWLDSAEQLRVIEDKVYIICTRYVDRETGIWLIKLNEEDGAFISEELIPIPVNYSYEIFYRKEVLITKNYIVGRDYFNKKILKANINDKTIEEIDVIDSNLQVQFFILGNRWITLPDGSVKYSLVWISADNILKVIDDEFNIYTISLTFSSNVKLRSSSNSVIYNINLKNLSINFFVHSNKFVVGLTDNGGNNFSAENIDVRNTYQNFPYSSEFYGNSFDTPNFDRSSNTLSVTNEGQIQTFTNKETFFVANFEKVALAANIAKSEIQVKSRIDIIDT